MDIQKIKELALANGFKLKEQASGNMDLNAYVYDFANAIEQAVKAQAVPEWISVEDEFPKKNLKVLLNLVTRKNGKPIKCIGFYSIEPDEEPCFVLDDNFTELKGVTHWVRLPDSPKAQEQSHENG